VPEETVAVMLLPVVLDCTVMLLELAAVTTPMKSSMASTLPGGFPARTFGCGRHDIWLVEIHRYPIG
jgi:hypothetical protein